MDLYQKVFAFIENPRSEGFEELAFEVFLYQLKSVPAYAVFCEEIGFRLEEARGVDDIPAISTSAFKFASLCSGTPQRVFETSGTTRGKERRGKHLLPSLELYRASAVAHLSRMLFPDNARLRMLSLFPTADIMPESSLSQMISWCIEEFGCEPSECVASRSHLDLDSARMFLERCIVEAAPVCILSTTASARALIQTLIDDSSPLKLPPGSRLMDTGGAKGQSNPITSAEFIELCHRWLGIEPHHVINEYGMTELSSQLYDVTAFNFKGPIPEGERVKLPPAWLRVSAVDPVTLKPVPDGEPGLLRFFDLANLHSVSCILTEDVGIISDGFVRVLGRAPMSEPRGCALRMNTLKI